MLSRLCSVRLRINSLPCQQRVGWVVLISAACGFILGVLQPAWQVAVEPAQVLAGLVHYPQTNPFYIYEVKTWTILHQIGALSLLAGLSEQSLSIALSGLAGALSAAGIAVWVAAITDDVILSIIAPFWVLFANPLAWGINYPIMLLGEIHTYGMLGFSAIFLAIGLMGAGQYRWGALLMGLTPAIHPSLGLWCSLIVLVCFVWDFRRLRPVFWSAARYAVMGYAITAVSFGFYLIDSSHLPQLEAGMRSQYLDVFLQYWDTHRVPLDLLSLNVLLIVVGVILCLIWPRFFKNDIPVDSPWLLRSFVVAAALGIGLSAVEQLPLPLPDALAILLPSRLLNFNILGLMLLVLGLLWRYRDRVWAQFSFAILLALSFLPGFAFIGLGLSSFALIASSRLQNGRLPVVLLAVGSLLAYLGFGLLVRHVSSPDVGGWVGPMAVLAFGGLLMWLSSTGAIRVFPAARRTISLPPIWMNQTIAIGIALRRVSLALLCVMVIGYGIRVNSNWNWRLDALRDRTSDSLLATASQSAGLLLIGPGPGMQLFQLLTRHPILLDPNALDMLPYALEGGPEFERIVRVVYGIDFYNPPELGRHQGIMPVEPVRTIWNERTPEQWASIKDQFDVSQIITLADWKLQLPVVARNDHVTLYQIP